MKLETRRRYSREFKAQAVELVGTGRPATEVAEELAIAASNLYKWVREAKRRNSGPSQLGSEGRLDPRKRDEEDEASELRRLRRENSQLQMENAILKKAAVILGTNPPKNDAP
jgi:transposase